jgi:tRNA nucleotidyltransferase (CCA-adding enzyme)
MSWLQKFPSLSEENWPFSSDLLPPNTYLVGGAVRDALLHREKEYLDLDFVLPQLAVETARKIADRTSAGFVVLDKQRQIARVVFKEGTADFARQEGDNLEKDLQRRDFTINAIAYNPRTDELIDPLEGLADLKRGILRMVSKANLEDDPLRLLRAYRQAAQLNFIIDPSTQSTIRTLAPLLGTVAGERVRAELGYLLASFQGSKWLSAAGEDGLLQSWFKNIKAENLQQIAKIDESVKLIKDNWFELASKYESEYYLAKLAVLVSTVPEEAEQELISLKYSRAEIRAVTIAIKNLPRLFTPMSLKEQYFFFLDVEKVFPILVVLVLALGINSDAIAPLINRYLDPNDQIAHPEALVTGNDLMQFLQIRPSPQIGKLLTEIQIARIEGKISTPQEALEYAASLLE